MPQLISMHQWIRERTQKHYTKRLLESNRHGKVRVISNYIVCSCKAVVRNYFWEKHLLKNREIKVTN